MVQCSKHVIPPAITANLTNQPAHDLVVGLNAQLRRVLTDRRLGTILLAQREPNDQDPLAESNWAVTSVGAIPIRSGAPLTLTTHD